MGNFLVTSIAIEVFPRIQSAVFAQSEEDFADFSINKNLFIGGRHLVSDRDPGRYSG